MAVNRAMRMLFRSVSLNRYVFCATSAIWRRRSSSSTVARSWPASLNNLAALYQAQGRYAEAEPLYRRSLAIVEKALGPDHPDVATILENYADSFRKTGRDTEAEIWKPAPRRSAPSMPRRTRSARVQGRLKQLVPRPNLKWA